MSEPKNPDPQTIIDALVSPDQTCFATFLTLIDPLAVSSRHSEWPTAGKYNPSSHATICRLKSFGLDESSIAGAVGISPATLKRWQEDYPQLKDDMDTALAISKGEIIRILMRMMTGDTQTAFNAVKLWLSTRTSEFRERSEVGILVANAKDIASSIRQMYGLDTGAISELPGPDAAALPPPDELDPIDQPQSHPEAEPLPAKPFRGAKNNFEADL